MELRHLRYFEAVAEELHFRRAAERLHMSQPPLSAAIRALEEEVGTPLLRRDRRKVELTDAGAAFLREAREVLDHVGRATDVARRTGAGEIGRLAVGFVGSSMYGRVPELLREFRDARPDVVVRMRELTTSAQVEQLLARRIDVGFVRPPVPAAGLRVQTLLEEGVVVALPRGHRLAQQSLLAPQDLVDEPFLTLAREEAPGIYAALADVLAAAGALPRISQTVAELQTAMGLVAAGFGLAVVPEMYSALGRPDVVYRRVEGVHTRVPLALASRDEEPSPVLQAFLATALAS